jgi:hypothetical protein
VGNSLVRLLSSPLGALLQTVLLRDMLEVQADAALVLGQVADPG